MSEVNNVWFKFGRVVDDYVIYDILVEGVKAGQIVCSPSTGSWGIVVGGERPLTGECAKSLNDAKEIVKNHFAK